MKFRIWHVFIVLLVLGLVTGGIAYAQSPGHRTRGVYTPAGQSDGEKFFKLGTTRSAAASATNTVISDGGADLGPTVAFTVPEGKKADIIATFSGELWNPGPSTDDACIGVLALTNEPRQMKPVGGITLFSQKLVHDGTVVNASIQQYLGKVGSGDHSVTFGMYAYVPDNHDQCVVGFRTLTVIANIY